MRMPTRPGVSTHSFARVPRAEIPRSSLDRSHGRKATFDGGVLYPVFVDEILPGDTFRLDMRGFARLATPIKPIMDNLYLDVFFFFVPNRLVWANWEKFCGSQDNPGDSTDFLVPVNNAAIVLPGFLGAAFGLPINTPNALAGINAMPFRAYRLIWDEWFRDQNLQNSLAPGTGNGPDSFLNSSLVRRGKRHDYFTSCLPFPQKGDEVLLPLGDTAPVVPDGSNDTPYFESKGAGTAEGAILQALSSADTTTLQVNAGTGAFVAGEQVGWDLTAATGLEADLSLATAASVNDVRLAFQMQRMLERDARGGTRYTEYVRAHFGVVSPDARLQRPEYLGGGTVPVNVSPVAQTAISGSTPQGNLAAVGTASWEGIGFAKSFTEHGYVIGMVAGRADLNYQQGINRMWSRQTRLDFYLPVLAHLGEQAVLSKEIWADGSASDETVFGYQERYGEYRYKPSEVTGLFKSDAAGTLDIWHLALDFATRPVLNASFIEDNPPIDRVIAVPSEPHFLLDCWFSLKCARPMPMFSVPGLVDHF